MSWSVNPNEPDAHETLFTTDIDGADTAQIMYALWIVMARMIERREVDRAPGATMLHFGSSGTNGYVDMTWAERRDGELVSIGDWTYNIWLPGLHAASLEHEDGADDLEQQVRCAIFDLSSELWHQLWEDGDMEGGQGPLWEQARHFEIPPLPRPQVYRLYYSSELSSSPEEIIS